MTNIAESTAVRDAGYMYELGKARIGLQGSEWSAWGATVVVLEGAGGWNPHLRSVREAIAIGTVAATDATRATERAPRLGGARAIRRDMPSSGGSEAPRRFHRQGGSGQAYGVINRGALGFVG